MPHIARASLDGEKVTELLNKIDKAIGEEPDGNIVLACLTMAIIIQHPDMEEDELIQAVLDTSGYVCMLSGEATEGNDTKFN